MSYVVRLISVKNGTSPNWIVPWVPAFTVDTLPDGLYIAIDGGSGDPNNDPSNGFFNSFFNRVPAWEPFSEDSSPPIASINITPGNTVGLTEPILIDIAGNGSWDVLSSTVTTVGNRGSFIKREEFLPSEDPTVNDEDTQSFQYTITVHQRSTIDTSAEVNLEYSIKILGHAYYLMGGIAYFPCVHHYIWDYQDDGGSTNGGGFISQLSELPLDGVIIDGTFSTLFRLGKTDFIDSDNPEQHTAFAFAAQQFSCPLANDPFGPPGTETVIVDPISLEVNGEDTPAGAWFQPDHLAVEKYFGFRWDNDDDTTALYDIDNGHRTTKDPLPLQMTQQLEPQ